MLFSRACMDEGVVIVGDGVGVVRALSMHTETSV